MSCERMQDEEARYGEEAVFQKCNLAVIGLGMGNGVFFVLLFFFITLLLSLNVTLKIFNLRLDGKELEYLF